MKKPIYVIVTTYNGAADMPLFLDSFKKHTDERDAQLVVVDNCSADNTCAIIAKEYPGAIIFRNSENLGFTGGHNRGMAFALSQGAEYVMLVNQDLAFEENWLSPLVALMEAHLRLGALQPLITQYPHTEKINAYGDSLHYLGFGFARGNGVRVDEWPFKGEWEEVAYASFAAVLLRASVLQKVGLFDEAFFMYHEDSDLSWRMRLQGYMCGATKVSRVAHHYDFNRSITKFYYIERNRFLILLRNYRLRTLVLIAPMLLFWECGMLAYSLVGFLFMKKTIGFREKMKGYAYFFSLANWRHILIHRRAIQSTRVIPDREIVRLFTDAIAFQDVENSLLSAIANPLTKGYWHIVKRWL